MSVLLRIAAVISLLWAVLLVLARDQVIAGDQLTTIARALGNGLAVASVVLAYMFWFAARDPAANRPVIYGAILLQFLKTANDLYELLVLLSGAQALISLADLVTSVALLVGLLEALPRTFHPQPADPSAAP